MNTNTNTNTTELNVNKVACYFLLIVTAISTIVCILTNTTA